MSSTIAEKVVAFNRRLFFDGKLPHGFRVMNPFLENPETLDVMQQFYEKYYNDNRQRKFIIGINPSRHGAGVTGVPFTDTKRLQTACGITMRTAHTHEVSSVFMYDMIAAMGGAKKFYQKFYINSPFPLALIRQTKDKKWVNANYYDVPAVFDAVKEFMIASLKKHIDIGLNTKEVFVLGKKNATFIEKLNKEAQLFERLTILEHPRFIQQYQSKQKQVYINKYLLAFGS
jgi:hypothetical protein